MKHEMGLQDKWFNEIKYGTKRFELRLFDGKRKQIRLGDTILFTSKSGDKLSCKVVGLLRAQTFNDIFNILPIELVANKTTSKTEMLKIMEQFYPLEKQTKLGVIAIGLKKI